MAECYFQERRQNQAEKYSGERFLSKGFSRSTGGASVSTGTLGKRVARAALARVPSPPPLQPGYARRPQRSKTQDHYRCGQGRQGNKGLLG